jgi:hypothetical protein
MIVPAKSKHEKRIENAGSAPPASCGTRSFPARGGLRVTIVAMTMIAAGVAANLGQASAATRPGSGLPWASGVYLTADTPSAASAFAAWRGRPVDIVGAWVGQSNWTQITDSTWLYRRWAGSGYSMAFSVPMLPNTRGTTIRACANGAYNAQWRQFGRVISSYGFGNSIIRLGWEFNGKWYRWKASDPAAWVSCWRHIVRSAWSTAPRLRWDWTVNRGVSSALADPAKAYPGNAYVSMIGVDSYDWWPPTTTASGWQQQLNGRQGLNYWLAFAEAHGKKLSVPEWGNTKAGARAGGDDPAYVKHMRAFFAAHASHIAFEINFQSPSTTGVSYMRKTVPRAASVYKAYF